MPLADTTLTQYKRGDIFFETGVGNGDGVARALSAGFRKIYSIEIAKQHIEEASTRFVSEIVGGRVEIIHGDSKIVMGDVLSVIGEPITFWLDAHWDFGPERGEVFCPLYEELTFIRNHPVKDHLILIDDMRVIGDKGHHWGKTVQKDMVAKMILEINPEYKITYTAGDLGPGGGGLRQDDILVAQI